MNSENLVPISSRTAREIKQMGKKGAIRSNEVQRKNKENKRKNQRLVDILRNILSSKVTSKGTKKNSKNSELMVMIISSQCVLSLLSKHSNEEILM